jgi:hypothetical protein
MLEVINFKSRIMGFLIKSNIAHSNEKPNINKGNLVSSVTNDVSVGSYFSVLNKKWKDATKKEKKQIVINAYNEYAF